MDRDKLFDEALKELKNRSERYFNREFNRLRSDTLNSEEYWHLDDLRAVQKSFGAYNRKDDFVYMHAAIWARTFSLLIGLNNLREQIILEGGSPKDDPRVHDYLRVINLTSLRYGVWTVMRDSGKIDWLLIHDESLGMAGAIGGSSPKHKSEFLYDVALSFAGEDRQIVSSIFDILKKKRIRIYFDQTAQSTMIGSDLRARLKEVYGKQSRYCVVFSSRDYARKEYTLLELETILERESTKDPGCLIRVKLDSVTLPGYSDRRVFIDGQDTSAETIAQLILSKLERPF